MRIARTPVFAGPGSSEASVPGTGLGHADDSASPNRLSQFAPASAPPFAVLIALWFGSTLARFAAALLVTSPTLLTDELTYWSLARSFHHGAHFLAYNIRYDVPSQLYSVLLSPLFGSGNSTVEYVFAKLLSSLLLCSVAFPAYFLAREIVNRREAMAVAILSLLVPGGVYTATVMAENLFYPMFVLCAWLGFRTLLRGKIRDAILTGVAFSVAYFVKPHILFLMVAYAVCVALWFFTQWLPWKPTARDFRTATADAVRRCIPFVVFAAGLMVRVRETAGYTHSIILMISGEGYAGTIQMGSHHLPWDFLADSATRLILVLALSTALLPLMAVIVAAFRLPRLDLAQRWFWIFLVCVSGIFLFMITRHNVLNDGHVRTHERYVFELSPLLFTWYFASLNQLPRRWLHWITAIIGLSAATVFAYMAPHLLTWDIEGDSPSISGAFWMLLRSPWHHARASILITLLVGGLICLLGSLFSRRLQLLVLCWGAVLIACNFGWYAVRVNFIAPEVSKFNDIALYMQSELPPDVAIGFLEDNADQRVGWYGAFWWSGPYYYYYREHQPNTDWFAVPLKSRPDGSLAFGASYPRVLLASDSIELPYPVVHYFADAHLRMYRLGDPAETK